ncbi:MAG: hypothetical protein QGH11_06490, partial [Pirellulaceae bacterium]|nr:hypothetical protein [Pirellulaceae bacterium]
DGWYAYAPGPWSEGALECYFWTLKPHDHARVSGNSWITYLDGKNPDFPESALRGDLATIRQKVAGMRKDETTPDTRLADDPMKFNPATVGTLRQLMMAGLDPGRGAAPLHCRLRYFDPLRRRAGVPEDVAALIDQMTDSQVRVTLVNTNQLVARRVVVQTGAYGEHQCTGVTVGNQVTAVDGTAFTVMLDPGAGAQLTIETDRYVNQPTLVFPWDRWKIGK